jgi:translation initiation factor IF-3
MFRGREMSHPELGKRILDHVAEQVGTLAKVEAAPKLDGRNMIMVLAPDRRAQQAAASATSASGPEAGADTPATATDTPTATVAATPAAAATDTPTATVAATPAPAASTNGRAVTAPQEEH